VADKTQRTYQSWPIDGLIAILNSRLFFQNQSTAVVSARIRGYAACEAFVKAGCIPSFNISFQKVAKYESLYQFNLPLIVYMHRILNNLRLV